MLHLLGHSVSLIIAVNGDQLHVLAKIKCKFEFGSILGHLFQIGTLAVYIHHSQWFYVKQLPVY